MDSRGFPRGYHGKQHAGYFFYPSEKSTQFNSTQLNLLMYGSCEAGLNKHREHIIKHKA